MAQQESARLITHSRDLTCPFTPSAALAEVRDAQEELPAMSVALGGGVEFEALAVTRYDDVRQVLGDPRFANGSGLPPATGKPTGLQDQPGFLLNYNGPEHARLRRMLTGAFTVKRVRSLQPYVEQVVAEQLDQLEKAGPGADLLTEFALPVPSKVICELLGVPYAEREEFQVRTEVILEGANLPPQARLAVVEELHDYIGTIVVARRADPGTSLLGGLVLGHGDELTDEELIGIAMLLLIAGHETTSNMLTLGTLALLQHPEQLAKVRDDDAVMTTAVEELLRHASIAVPTLRLATEDITVGTHQIKAGQRVLCSALAANWDPALIGEATDLDITRKPGPHLTFGLGPHQCLGQQLTRLELRVAFPALLRRFPRLRLAVPESELRYRVNSFVFALRALPVAW